MNKFLALVILLFISAGTLLAQAPSAFNYQAVLRNADGQAIANQATSIRISILSGTADGDIVYQETHSPTTNDFGLVVLEIGEGTITEGTLEGLNWGTTPHFLLVEMDATGGTNYIELGVSQLLSVPYALHSKTAETITGEITESDPVYAVSEAYNITSIDISNLGNLSGTNTGDQDLSSLATKTALGDSTAQVRSEIKQLGSESDPVYAASEAINVTSADITKLANLSGTNTGDQDISGIALNATSISTNASAIALNSAKDTTGIYHDNREALDAVTGINTGNQDISGIALNATSISGNTTDISSNVTGISTNATAISTNASAIALNSAKDTTGIYHANREALDAVTGINTGNQDISGIALNATSISGNTTDISTNATGISSNATAISTNASAIALNSAKDTTGIYHANREALDAVTGINTGNQDISGIALNATSISINTSAIALNSAKDTTGIYHANREALDAVTGINTGNQDLTPYVEIDNTTAWDKDASDDFGGNYNNLADLPNWSDTINNSHNKGGYLYSFLGAENDYMGGKNSTDESFTVVVGGWGNSATYSYGVVVGGSDNIASGQYSGILSGRGNKAKSFGETVLGLWNTDYTPNQNNQYDAADRLFVIGNGTADDARSDALVMLKNGNTTMNGELTINNGTNTDYALPTDRGTSGQVLGTSGDGGTAWTTVDTHSHSGTGLNSFLSGKNTYESEEDGTYENTVSGDYASIIGGMKNDITSNYGFIGGGQGNTVSGNGGVVLGGSSNLASGYSSIVAGGGVNKAKGSYSFVAGTRNSAESYGESVFGYNSTTYTPTSPTAANATDRLFVIGNGSLGNPSDALVMLKNGNTTLNGQLTVNNGQAADGNGYKLPINQGTDGQVLGTDGAGGTSWSDVPASDIIQDSDGDTKIELDAGGFDLDAIKFTLNGSLKWYMSRNTLYAYNTGNSVFIGEDAGLNDDGVTNNNTAIGHSSLYTNQAGTNNTAIGYQSLNHNHGNSGSTAIGYNAMQYADQRSMSPRITYNTAIGYEALRGSTDALANTGQYNTVIGSQALMVNITGELNTASGYNALTSNTTGSNNIAYGAETLHDNLTGSGNVAIGYQAGYSETGSNKLYIENSNSTTPLIYGEFDNDLLRVNGNLDVQGGKTVNVTTVGSNYTLLSSDYILNISAPSIDVTITLPTAQCLKGRVIVVKEAAGWSTNIYKISTENSETIDSASEFIFSTGYESVKIYSDGSNWFLLGN
jgi:recombinational DNA repair protein RecR